MRSRYDSAVGVFACGQCEPQTRRVPAADAIGHGSGRLVVIMYNAVAVGQFSGGIRSLPRGLVAPPHAPRIVVFCVQSVAPVRTSRAPLRVVAQRAVTKKVQVVLTQQIPNLGNAGDLKSVPVGHYRNYLQPQGLAMVATEGILSEIQKKQAAEDRAKLEEKAKAQAMATALSTIGKFIIKKKIGEEDQIFGSVSAADIVEAIRMQTGRDVEKRNVAVPDIKSLGTYDCTVKLHPEVVGSFKVVVQKDTSN